MDGVRLQRGPLVLDVVLAVSRHRPLPRYLIEYTRGDLHHAEARLRILARMAILAITMTTAAEVHALRRLHGALLRHDGVRLDQVEPAKLQLLLGWLATVSGSRAPAERHATKPGSLSDHPVDAEPEAGLPAVAMP